MSNKRKQIALDLDKKIVIINEIEAGKKQAAVAAACGLSKQTLLLNINFWRLRWPHYMDIDLAFIRCVYKIK